MTTPGSIEDLNKQDEELTDDVTIAMENIAKKRAKRNADKFGVPNNITDLNIFAKAFSFFVLIPKNGVRDIVKIKPGCILKEQQWNYYLVTGISFFIISALIATNSGLSFFWLWPLGFGISYLFDIFYNRQRQIDYIKRCNPPDSTGFHQKVKQ
jgi:hypothetical protein